LTEHRIRAKRSARFFPSQPLTPFFFPIFDSFFFTIIFFSWGGGFPFAIAERLWPFFLLNCWHFFFFYSLDPKLFFFLFVSGELLIVVLLRCIFFPSRRGRASRFNFPTVQDLSQLSPPLPENGWQVFSTPPPAL